MKKSTAVVSSIIASILLIVVGIFIGISTMKINKTPNNSNQTQLADFIRESLDKSRPVEEKEKERIEVEDIGRSEYQSIVLLQDKDPGHGTGFIVSKNKILTNEHVTKESGKSLFARLRDENGEFVDFKVKNVINAPNGEDLSIVEVFPNDDGKNIGDNIKMLEFATQEEIKKVKVGDFVHTVGYPGDKKYSTLWYSHGQVLFTDSFIITYDTLTSGGNSGSPLLNEDGKIIGLTNSGQEEGNKNITTGFLLTDSLYKFIKENI